MPYEETVTMSGPYRYTAAATHDHDDNEEANPLQSIKKRTSMDTEAENDVHAYSYVTEGYAGAEDRATRQQRLQWSAGRQHDVQAQTNVYVSGPSAMNSADVPRRGFMSKLTPSWLHVNITASGLYRQVLWFFGGMVLLWVPGLVAILCYNALKYPFYANPTCFGVGLFWWSVWLASVWAGMWICSMLAFVAPIALRLSLGVLAISFKRQITYLNVTRRYLAILLWSLVLWITYLAIVWSHFPGHEGVDSNLLDPLSSGNSTTAAPSSNSSSHSSSSSAADSVLGSLWGTTTGSAISPSASQAAALMSNYSTNTAWLISFSRFFFGLVLCSALLLFQKLSIQSIANNFHEVTYSDRIRLAKYHTGVLVALFAHAKKIKFGTAGSLIAEHGTVAAADALFDQAGMTSKPKGAAPEVGGQALRAGKIDWPHFRNLLSLCGRQTHTIVRTTTTVATPFLGNPYSPEAIVEASLENSDETRKLARRIFEAYAAAKSHREGQGDDLKVRVVTLSSITPLFSDKSDARRAFTVLDRDGNGDCTWEEVLSACLEIHRERMCLLASMHDVDSAVAKLDHILRGVWATMSCVIVAALLSVRFSTLIASLGTILLGLSWLVSSTAQESLASIVWVFCKHPIDVGDVVVVPGLLSIASSTTTKDSMAALQGYTDGDTFIVQEVQLLSTVLKTTTTGKHVQVSNYLLAQKPLVNLRRSGPIEETFALTVAYFTPLESIEMLRGAMAEWLLGQGRDFRPGLDIAIEGLDDQSQMKLSLSIRYKSNWQDPALRIRRRNRWISALKQLLAQHNIGGPGQLPQSSSLADGAQMPSSQPVRNVQRPTGNEAVILFDFMDASRSSLDGRDEFELFGHKGQFAGKYADDDRHLECAGEPQQPPHSRLNQALEPMHDFDGSTMYKQHSASTTHLAPVTVVGWRAKEMDGKSRSTDDIELGR